MTALRPAREFDWMRVSWGGPDEPRTETCSYCDAPLDDESVPLIMWNQDGWTAEFCDACQIRYWGAEPIERIDDDDH